MTPLLQHPKGKLSNWTVTLRLVEPEVDAPFNSSATFNEKLTGQVTTNCSFQIACHVTVDQYCSRYSAPCGRFKDYVLFPEALFSPAPNVNGDETSKTSVYFEHNYLVVLLFSVTTPKMRLLTPLTGSGTLFTAGLQQLSSGVKNEEKAIIAIREG